MAQARTSRSRRMKLGVAAGAVTMALAPAVLAPGIASAQGDAAVDTGSAETLLQQFLDNVDLNELVQQIISGSAGGDAEA